MNSIPIRFSIIAKKDLHFLSIEHIESYAYNSLKTLQAILLVILLLFGFPGFLWLLTPFNILAGTGSITYATQKVLQHRKACRNFTARTLGGIESFAVI